MFNYLLEAKRIVTELAYKVDEAGKFKNDAEFLKCLADEIKESIDVTNAKALFEITDTGDIHFKEITEEENATASSIYIPLTAIKEQIELSREQQIIDEGAKVAKECLDLDLTLKKKELIEKLLKKT